MDINNYQYHGGFISQVALCTLFHADSMCRYLQSYDFVENTSSLCSSCYRCISTQANGLWPAKIRDSYGQVLFET